MRFEDLLLGGLETEVMSIAAFEILDSLEYNEWLRVVWEKDRGLAAETNGKIRTLLDKKHVELGLTWTAVEMRQVLRELDKLISEANIALDQRGFMAGQISNSFAGNMITSRTDNSWENITFREE